MGAESYDIAIFAYNHATHGGAIMLDNATLVVESEANLIFSHNSGLLGGTLELMNSIVHVNTSGIDFYNSGGSRISKRGVLIYCCARSAREFLETTPTFG